MVLHTEQLARCVCLCLEMKFLTKWSQCCDIETKISKLEYIRVHLAKVSVLVLRPLCQGINVVLRPYSHTDYSMKLGLAYTVWF